MNIDTSLPQLIARRARKSKFEKRNAVFRVREVRAAYIAAPPTGESITKPSMIAHLICAMFDAATDLQENFYGIYLDARSRVIGVECVFRGSTNVATVYPRDVLRMALCTNAVAVTVAHNHPSGDPAPSSEDLLFTRRLIDAGRLLNIDIVDHVIIGRAETGRLNFVSLRERGVM